MYTDLILFENENNNLGFSNYMKIETISASSKQELEKRISRSKSNLVIVRGGELNRNILENKKVDILIDAEKISKPDSLHYRNSGLNHVLCKLAYKHDIAIAFNFNDVLRFKGVDRSVLLGRMSQNVRLCRKYKLRMVLASFASNKFELKNLHDLISFGIVIGMTPSEARDSLIAVSKILEEKKGRISDGLRRVKEKGL